MSFLQWFLWERLGEKLSLDLRRHLIATYLQLNPQAAGRHDLDAVLANLSSHLTTDIKMLREYVIRFYGGLPRELCLVVILSVSLYILSPSLFLLFLLGVAPAVLAARVVGKRIKRRAAAALANSADLTEWIQQRLLGIETIKHYRSEDLEMTKFERLTEDLYKRYVSAAKAKALTSPLIEAIAVVAIVVVLYFAFARIAADESSGTIFMSFFATLALLSQAGAKLGRYLNANREGSAATARLQYALSHLERHRTPPGGLLSTKPGDRPRIRCEALTIHYDGAESPALDGFSHTFEAGRFYVVRGPSGAGKSSLIKAILGLVAPTSGSVAVEHPPTRTKVPFVYLPQNVELLPGTIAENVAYPDAEPDLPRVWAALATLNLEEVVKALPDGEQTIVGSGGRDLSGGQAQRMLLARIVYHDSPFVVLDEATSALDPELENLTLSTIRRLVEAGRLVIMVAHRQKAIAAADVTLVIERGRLDSVKVIELDT